MSGRPDYEKITYPTATGGGVIPSTEPLNYVVTMVNANAEYSQALPNGTKKFMVHTRDESSLRYAWVTGKVATPTDPIYTVASGKEYYEDGVNLTSKTLFFASSTAGKVIEIQVWT